MHVYVVADIFGITLALHEFLATLSNEKPDQRFNIVDPYQGKTMNFANETDAYHYFIEHVGVEQYASHLRSVLTADNAIKTLVGFSVGASAIWAISDNKELRVAQAVYFYGSQIRNLLHIVPQIKSTVVFPIKEDHFCVETLAFKIEKLPNVSTKRCKYLHGFMNKHSVNFNQKAYRTYKEWLCQELS